MTDTNDTNTEARDDAVGAPPETAKGKAPRERIAGLKCSAETVSAVERRLSVEVPWEEVQKRLDEAYKELAQGVSLKGFRRGKVPRKMMEQLFHKHVDKEMVQRLVQDSIESALTETGIKPVGEPRFEFVEDGIARDAPFRYSATMEVVPQIEAKDYFGIEAHARRGRITDEDVDLALRSKQREHTDYRSVEGRATRAGDMVLVDVLGKIEGKPVSLEGVTIDLADRSGEPLPGLAAALTGISADDEDVEVELDVPAPGRPAAEGPATLKARLLVTLHDVKEKVVPNLDDDFAQDTGEAETLDGLRQVLRKKLEEQDEERAREEARRLLVRQIIARNDIPVVPALVDRYLEQRLKLQKVLIGMDPEVPSRQDERLKDTMRDDAVEMVKSGLILEAIAEREHVEVLDADVEKRLAELAASRDQNVAKVRAEYEKEGAMAALRRRIREDKTLDLLSSKATIVIDEPADEPEPTPTAPAAQEAQDDTEGAAATAVGPEEEQR